jgi:hypothetical protein
MTSHNRDICTYNRRGRAANTNTVQNYYHRIREGKHVKHNITEAFELTLAFPNVCGQQQL